MGLSQATIKLSNPRDSNFKPIEVKALDVISLPLVTGF